MQNEEAIQDFMARIQATAAQSECDFCHMMYAHMPQAFCWFNEAANPKALKVSLVDLTSAVGHQRVEECANPDIVQMVLEIQSLAAGSQ